MACLLRCCLCIPLEPACFIIGIFYIVVHLVWLKEHVEEYIEYQEREEKYRDPAQQILYIFRILLAASEVLLGVFIIFVACKRSVSGLKMCACAAGVTAVLNFISQLSMPVLGRPLTPYVLTMVVFLYLAVVVYSYGFYLEGEQCDAAPPYDTNTPHQVPNQPWHQEPQQRPNAPIPPHTESLGHVNITK